MVRGREGHSGLSVQIPDSVSRILQDWTPDPQINTRYRGVADMYIHALAYTSQSPDSAITTPDLVFNYNMQEATLLIKESIPLPFQN